MIVHLTERLITPPLRSLIGEAERRFHKQQLASAPLPELIGQLSGYQTVTTNLNCGGYCDGWNQEIAIKTIHPRNSTFRSPSGLIVSGLIDNRHTILHELSHTFQFKLGDVVKPLLSQNLYTERQAESIAYQLYRRFYGPVDFRIFCSYFYPPAVDFLRKWYGNWVENDVSYENLRNVQ